MANRRIDNRQKLMHRPRPVPPSSHLPRGQPLPRSRKSVRPGRGTSR